MTTDRMKRIHETTLVHEGQWAYREIAIAIAEEGLATEQRIPAMVLDELAVHPAVDGLWRVTHLRTGVVVVQYVHWFAAMDAAVLLSDLDWAFGEFGDGAVSATSGLKERVREIDQRLIDAGANTP